MIYLDHNATTPVDPTVVDAMVPFLREHWGNPSSDHPWGRAARAGLDQARAQVAGLLGCAPDEVVFTSGGTEADNLALRGVAEARPRGRHLVVSAVEHPAIQEPSRWLAAHGWRVTEAAVGPAGAVDAGAIEIDDDTALVSVMLANNETGVLQPLRELAVRAHEAGALVHTDAAQAVGKIPVDVGALGVDLLTVAGHKLYAPKGVGALYVRRGTPLAPFALGGGHESGRRPGTENVASIVGLGAACALAAGDLRQQAERQATLRDRLFDQLAAVVPGLVCVGARSPRLPNTLCMLFPDTTGDAVLQHARETLAASTGSACHAGEVHPSAVLLAMGFSPRAARGSVRLSLGRGTTDDDIVEVAAALCRAWHAARD